MSKVNVKTKTLSEQELIKVTEYVNRKVEENYGISHIIFNLLNKGYVVSSITKSGIPELIVEKFL